LSCKSRSPLNNKAPSKNKSFDRDPKAMLIGNITIKSPKSQNL
jgi:hypothetical protein